MSEHHDVPAAHAPHARHEDHVKGPHDPKEIDPKMTSDIAYWSKEFGVTGDQLTSAFAPTEPTSIRSAPPSTPTKPCNAAALTLPNHQRGSLRRLLTVAVPYMAGAARMPLARPLGPE